jgi:hypothetical protein
VKLNRGGLKLCGIYIGYFVLLSGLAISSTDPKGGFLLGQLSIVPAGLFLTWSGLLRFIPPNSWLNSVFLTLPLSLVITYLIGWAISGIVNFKDPSAPVVEDPPDWHKR